MKPTGPTLAAYGDPAARIVPTEPGWWWRADAGCVWVESYKRGLVYEWIDGGVPQENDVYDDGQWLAPVLSATEARDLTAARDTAVAALAAALAETDRLRADLAACRGEDIGEWRCDGEGYYCGDPYGDGPVRAVERHVDGVRWIPLWAGPGDTVVRGAPCAHILDAMAAALALGGAA